MAINYGKGKNDSDYDLRGAGAGPAAMLHCMLAAGDGDGVKHGWSQCCTPSPDSVMLSVRVLLLSVTTST